MMKKKMLFMLIALFCLLFPFYGGEHKTNGEVIFFDDFTSSEMDHGEYKYTNGVGSVQDGKWWTAAYNHGNELQYYTRYDVDNSVEGPSNKAMPGHQTNFVMNGDTLNLVMRKETYTQYIPSWKSPESWWWKVYNHNGSSEAWYGNYDYTSGWIQTVEKFRYGYFEVRCKIPNSGRVAWPAFWLFGGTGDEVDGSGPFGENASEIDIFEFAGYTSNEFTSNVHNYFDKNYYASQYGAGAHSEYSTSGNTTTVHHYYDKNLSFNVSDWHTYGCEWTPRKITWYIDGQVVRTYTGMVPVNAMTLILNQALPNWDGYHINDGYPGSTISFPSNFEIDYVKVKQSPKEDLTWYWGNKGSGWINNWAMNTTDKFITGDVDGNGKDDLVSVSASGYSYVMNFDGEAWNTSWGNNGSGKIHWWSIGSGDQFFTGDFDGDNKDELLAISQTGYSAVMDYYGGSTGWYTKWTNMGNGKISSWYINPGDKYIIGDFDDDGKDELVCTSYTSDYVFLMDYGSSGWSVKWYTSSGSFGGWNLNPGDAFVAGDYNGDGKDEILATNYSTNYAKAFYFSGSNWYNYWGNYGNDKISSWYINPGDKFAVADFDKDGKEEIFAFAANGWSQKLDRSGNSFVTTWNNEGIPMTHDPDYFFGGNFYGSSRGDLLAIAPSKWTYFMEYNDPDWVVLPTC